jgi:hypothetical protein
MPILSQMTMNTGDVGILRFRRQLIATLPRPWMGRATGLAARWFG